MKSARGQGVVLLVMTPEEASEFYRAIENIAGKATLATHTRFILKGAALILKRVTVKRKYWGDI
jgi:hypothetical protein